MKPWFIYILKDPRHGKPRYVGWTINPRQRLRDHCKPSQLLKQQHRDKWIFSLRKIGLVPLMEIIETGQGDGWDVSEQKWISHYRRLYPELTNHTDGGEGTIGRLHSEVACEKMRQARKGTRPCESAIINARTITKGVALSVEHRRKIGEGNKGKIRSEECRAKLRAFNTGRKASEETRLKMSISHLRRQHEHR